MINRIYNKNFNSNHKTTLKDKLYKIFILNIKLNPNRAQVAQFLKVSKVSLC